MKIKKIILALLVVISSTSIFAQVERSNYKQVVERFTYFYNNNLPDSIFNIFSKDMQQALPLKDMVIGLNQQLGAIKSTEFITKESVFTVYKVQFDRGVLALNISIDGESKINGLMFKPYVPNNIPVIERNQTKLILPFNNEWFVFWGGDTKEENYHVAVQSQKNAFDFVINDKSGKSFRTDGQKNEDYYCFGEKLFSPCVAEVVLAVDGIKDNIPFEMNPFFPTGNTVVLKTVNNEYIYLCHFKKHSIVVEEGQQVKQGDLLGLCGNSGNSSEAHLHFHIQNVERMDIATGVKCYFEKVFVNGEEKDDYSPRKSERASNFKR